MQLMQLVWLELMGRDVLVLLLQDLLVVCVMQLMRRIVWVSHG